MDIMGAEKQKKYIKLALYLLRKKLNGCSTSGDIYQDMDCCSNPAVRIIRDIIKEEASKFDTKYHSKVMEDCGLLGLWIMYKDTAYRDSFFNLIRAILDHKEELEKVIEPYLKDKEDYYVNTWIRSRKKTAELRKKGVIPEYAKSHEETIFTPTAQQKRLKKYYSK